MPTRADAKWADISNFQPGIADDPGIQYPAGQAQRDSTFRCISNHDGALIPLPARTAPAFDVTEEAATPSGGGYCLTGVFVPPFQLLPSGTINANVNVLHELFVGIEWLQGGNHRQRLRRFRVYEDPGTASDLIKDVTFADAAVTLIPVGMSFATTRVLRATPLNPGYPVVMALCPFGATNSYLIQFPDETAPTLTTPFVVSTAFLLNFFCHQGRTLVNGVSAYNQGPTSSMFGNEEVKYTPVNSSASFSTPASVWVPENPSGFNVLASMSANEAFAVKAVGGLYVQGDVADPIIVNLPMVTGADVRQVAAVTKIGVVYANRESGVWVWQHGDTSKLLSPRLTPDFWRPATFLGDWGGNNVTFSVSDDWVLVPNNWLYDTDQQAWWRLEDTSVARIRNFTCFSDYIYGSIAGYFTNEDPFPIHRWVRNVLANSYSWRSQPLWHTIDTDCTIREVVVRAKGVGSVVVTFTNEAGATDTATFTFTSTTVPKNRRADIKLTGSAIDIKLVATGTSGSDIAPTIYSVHYSYIENTHVAQG